MLFAVFCITATCYRFATRLKHKKNQMMRLIDDEYQLRKNNRDFAHHELHDVIIMPEAKISRNAEKKIHKRVRFDVNPLPCCESDSSEDDIHANKIHESEVLEEDPLDPNRDVAEGIVLTENDFWDYVYGHVWSGRLRVTEGNLLRALIRVSEEFL